MLRRSLSRDDRDRSTALFPLATGVLVKWEQLASLALLEVGYNVADLAYSSLYFLLAAVLA